MLERFLAYINKNELPGPENPVLLAVSGGIDSMAMAHLFLSAGYKPAIAHCNFKLRGKESDGDQEFVRKFALDKGLEFFTTDFQTRTIAKEKNISIQMAARDMRYSWFHELAKENAFSHIAIAHNRDDLVETFMINLARGTGIHGLTGIKLKAGKIIRPLLFAERSEIEQYVQNEQIAYREDSSNAETKYLRNKIRHHIIPLFKSLNPAFTDTILNETVIFQSVENLYRQKLNELKDKTMIIKQDEIRLNITLLRKENITVPLLFDLLEDYNFSYGTISDMLESLDKEPGKMFYSDNYEAVKDRTDLIIRKITQTDQKEYFIYQDTREYSSPLQMHFRVLDNNPFYKIQHESSTAQLDLEELEFPLKLRHWKKGDYFHPLGLKGKKKLSDFFIDKKINLLDKHKQWILISGENIVWVVGQQIDDRYKITSATRKILQIELIH